MNTLIKESVEKIWGPVTIAYASWVLEESGRLGIKRLYFLARDAYPVYLAARELTRDTQDIELRYLRVSRYALRLPELEQNSKSFPEEMFYGGMDVSFSDIFYRGGLNRDEIVDVAGILGFTGDRDRKLSYREILEIRDRSRRKWKKIRPFIDRHIAGTLETAEAYLCQEGFDDDTAIGVVDSGWMGSVYRSLVNISGRSDLEGFYFGLYAMPSGVDASHLHTFYFGPHGDILRKALFANCLYEAVMSEPVGMTYGYRRDPDGGATVLTNAVDRSDLSVNMRIIEAMEEYLCDRAHIEAYVQEGHSDPSLGTDAVRMCEKALDRLMFYPTPNEVRVFGDIPFCDDVTDAKKQPLAAYLDHDEIKGQRTIPRLIRSIGLDKTPIRESAWIYASIVRCGRHVEWSLICALICRILMYIRMDLMQRRGK